MKAQGVQLLPLLLCIVSTCWGQQGKWIQSCVMNNITSQLNCYSIIIGMVWLNIVKFVSLNSLTVPGIGSYHHYKQYGDPYH